MLNPTPHSGGPARSLPWLAPTLERARAAAERGHALLLHGAAGDGVFECAELIAHAWLCEASDPSARPCGQCASCHLLQGGAHPDLHRLLPETLREQLGVQGQGGDGGKVEPGGKARRKPSRQIRIEEVRAAIDWIVTTSSRGGAKIVLIHPAEAMNLQSASALLKTLEEPPAGARLLLTTEDPARLLPTVRSRCQVLRLEPPRAGQARAWLLEQGMAEPDVLLAASSGRPLEALTMSAAGVDARRWSALPAAVLARQAQAFAGLALPAVISALQKLCHDGLALAAGAPPRFFPDASLQRPAAPEVVARWSRDLARLARHAEHAWNDALALDALLARAAAAWAGDESGIRAGKCTESGPQAGPAADTL